MANPVERQATGISGAVEKVQEGGRLNSGKAEASGVGGEERRGSRGREPGREPGGVICKSNKIFKGKMNIVMNKR